VAEEQTYGVNPSYLLPDELWERLAPLLPPPRQKKVPGRPRMSDRQAMTAVFYVLRTGCQWKALPRSLGAPSTVHDRFRMWREAGVFAQMWQVALSFYDDELGIEWEWQAVDGAMTKAPLGGKRYGAEPDGSRQERDQAQSADRWPRDPLGSRCRRRQPTRHETAGADAGEPGP